MPPQSAPNCVHHSPNRIEDAVFEKQIPREERRPRNAVHQFDGPVLDRRVGDDRDLGERAVDRNPFGLESAQPDRLGVKPA